VREQQPGTAPKGYPSTAGTPAPVGVITNRNKERKVVGENTNDGRED